MSAQTRTLALLAWLLVGAACDDLDWGVAGPPPDIPSDPALAVEPSNIDLVVGGTAQLTGRFRGSRTLLQDLIWTSSDPEVAAVSPNGMVTARGEGVATITATDGKKNAVAEVTVGPVSQPHGGGGGRGGRQMRPF
jgi:Bacterial Ig-like domain (group 2)